MLGLTGFIKKNLDMQGKLPDKWKDFYYKVIGNYATLDTESVPPKCTISNTIGYRGTDRDFLLCTHNLTTDSYGYVQFNLNPQPGECLSVLIPNGDVAAIAGIYNESLNSFSPSLTSLHLNDGGWIRKFTGGIVVNDGSCTFYTTSLSPSGSTSSTIPDGFYAICLENVDGTLRGYIRKGDNNWDTKTYAGVPGDFNCVRIVANAITDASKVGVYEGNLYTKDISECPQRLSVLDLH